MRYPSNICKALADPLTTLQCNLELLQDENANLMESERFQEILYDMATIERLFRQMQEDDSWFGLETDTPDE